MIYKEPKPVKTHEEDSLIKLLYEITAPSDTSIATCQGVWQRHPTKLHPDSWLTQKLLDNICLLSYTTECGGNLLCSNKLLWLLVPERIPKRCEMEFSFQFLFRHIENCKEHPPFARWKTPYKLWWWYLDWAMVIADKTPFMGVSLRILLFELID